MRLSILEKWIECHVSILAIIATNLVITCPLTVKWHWFNVDSSQFWMFCVQLIFFYANDDNSISSVSKSNDLHNELRNPILEWWKIAIEKIIVTSHQFSIIFRLSTRWIWNNQFRCVTNSTLEIEFIEMNSSNSSNSFSD